MVDRRTSHRRREQRLRDLRYYQDYGNWLRFQRYSPRTITTYVQKVATFNDLLRRHGKHILTATGEDLASHYPKHRSAAAHNGLRSALIHFYEYANHQGLRRGNPVRRHIPSWPTQNGLPRPYQPDEQTRILTAAHQLGGRHLTLVALGYYAGLRMHEALALRWSDIDQQHLNIQGKGQPRQGKKHRRVPIAPPLAAILAAWRQECPSQGWILPTTPAGRHNPRGWTATNDIPANLRTGHHWYRKVKAQAGITTPGGYHRLRHTFATATYHHTHDLLRLARWLGHSKPTTTVVYALVDDQGDQEAIQATFGAAPSP